jgi:hypothetical protein
VNCNTNIISSNTKKTSLTQELLVFLFTSLIKIKNGKNVDFTGFLRLLTFLRVKI